MADKYVVVELKGVEEIFPFPKRIDHDRWFEAIGAVRMGSDRSWDREYRMATAVSAGFITNGRCHGESETLKLSSRGDADTALLRKLIGHQERALPPAAGHPTANDMSASMMLRSIIDDGFLSETSVGRYHHAMAAQTAHQRREAETVMDLLRQIVGGDTGKNVLWKLSKGQSTETAEGKAWLAAKALVDQAAHLPPATATQHVWVVDDDRGEHIMMCPKAPTPEAMEALAIQIERNVLVGEFLLLPALRPAAPTTDVATAVPQSTKGSRK
jgi:hypothetical protein